MNKVTEVWIDVPGTDGRFMFSNKGHLKQVGVCRRRGNHNVIVFTNKIIPIVSDYISGRLGCYLCYDNEKHFFDCQSLLTLFEGIPAGVNNDEIVAAIKKETRNLYGEIFKWTTNRRRTATSAENGAK